MPRKKHDTSLKVLGKRKRPGVSSGAVEDAASSGKPAVKLRVKLGYETTGDKRVVKPKYPGAVLKKAERDEIEADLSDLEPLTIDEGCDMGVPNMEDDEEAWLDALENGDLDDYGELKKEKDPSLMTARQKALKERTSVSSSKSFANVTLLGATKETDIVVTEEAQKRKEEKNKRRKLQAVKKAEESQKLTIERLIKQQGSKMNKERLKKSGIITDNGTATQQQKPDTKILPKIRYVSKGTSLTLTLPAGMEFLSQTAAARPGHVETLCAVCGSKKMYSCSKTGVPLCSLNCYRTNLKVQLAT